MKSPSGALQSRFLPMPGTAATPTPGIPSGAAQRLDERPQRAYLLPRKTYAAACIDHTSVEVFAGDGQTEGCHSLSSRFYFDGMGKCVDFFTIEGGVRLERLSSWELKAVNWPCGKVPLRA